jgi:hypothetical protein
MVQLTIVATLTAAAVYMKEEKMEIAVPEMINAG